MELPKTEDELNDRLNESFDSGRELGKELGRKEIVDLFNNAKVAKTELARAAYQYADAMLAERAKRG